MPLSLCWFGFISVAVIEQGEGIYFDSQSEAYGLPWQGGCVSRRTSKPITLYFSQRQRENRRYREAIKPQDLPPVTYFLYQGHIS